MGMHLRLLVLCLFLSGCALASSRATVRLIDGVPQESAFVSPHAYENYLAGQIALLRGRNPEAIQRLESALVFDAGSAYLHTRVAEIYAATGKEQEAQAHLGHALRLDPTLSEALILQGQIYFRQHDTSRSEASLKRCIESNPTSPGAYLAYAETLEALDRGDDARRVLEEMVRRVGDAAEAHGQLALLCLRQVDYACAARHLGLALHGHTDLDALVRLAHVRRSRGELRAAVALLREAFDRSGGSFSIAAMLLDLLDQLHEAQGLDDLLGVLRESAGTDPARVRALLALCLDMKRPAHALAILDGEKGAVRLASFSVERAAALAQLGRGAEAKDVLLRSLSGDERVAATVELARILGREGAHAQASQVLRRGLSRDPHESRLVLALSLSLFLEGKVEPSLGLVREALRVRPEERDLLLGLGVALERAGRWRDAIVVVRQILARHPRDAAAHNFIGYSQVEHGDDLGAAERSIRRALYLAPGEGYVLDSLGWLYFRRGRLAEAQRLLRMAAFLSPRDAEVLGHLAEAAAARRDFAEAVRLLRNALALCGDAPLGDRLKKRLAELEKARARIR